MKIIRVFPSVTKATPDDALAYYGDPPLLFPPEADEIHISITFSWDRARGERLAEAWEKVAPVKVGGPGVGMAGGDFVPGKYLKPGYVITSRGCPNRCWYCGVWKREGDVRELPITEGTNVLDDNLLACSTEHISGVLNMLKRQRGRVALTGGLEARRLDEWRADALADMRAKFHRIYFAFDKPADRDPLFEAGEKLRKRGFARRDPLCSDVLIGYPNDSIAGAESRLTECYAAGFMPFAMLYRGEDGKRDREWARFQRTWNRPALIEARMRREGA